MKICLSCEGVTSADAQHCSHCRGWLLPVDQVHYPDRRGEAEATNPLLGTVLDGKYRLQSVLGRGGLGTVYRAVHTGSLMAVAVKLLHPRFSTRPEYRRALLPEARRAATVAHERCARLLDVGEAEDGVAYLAMELVDGQTLESLVRRGPLAPSHALAVLTQIAEALVAIHGAGLVHCDLSPRNVMVAVDRGVLRTKVLDFGIARSAAIAGSPRARPGEFAGFVNPAFAAPEHLAGRPVDARADLFSLGMLGWLLSTGSLPVDDSDPRRAARAIVAGELRPFPLRSGVPRRLQRLLGHCLRLDPQARPASALDVLRELQRIAAVRRPVLGSAALAAAAIAAMAWLLVSIDTSPPFLRLVAGSPVELLDRPPTPTTPVQHLPQQRLATLSFHFGGFPADRLRVDVSRDGTVLLRANQRPEVDAAGGVCTLSIAQPQWRDVVQSLASSSREKPVDVSFVVPGVLPLGALRVRLDDDPPQLEWSLQRLHEGGLNASTQLVWKVEDPGGLESVAAVVRWQSGREQEFPLSEAGGEFALGAALAAASARVDDLGPGEVRCLARDRAGNTSGGDPVAFRSCDVAAPAVVEVTGPAGEPFVPCVGERARLRVRLSANEPGCLLRVAVAGGREFPTVPLVETGAWQVVELPLSAGDAPAGAAPLLFVVEDPHGNRTERAIPVQLRDRSVRLTFAAEGPGFAVLGPELVLAEAGARATVHFAPSWTVARALLEPAAAGRGPTEPVKVEPAGPGSARIEFGPLAPGAHRLQVALEDPDGGGQRSVQDLSVRVLPSAIEVRVPMAGSRFLPGLLQDGVLASHGAGLHEGPGWRIDPELRPYLDGSLWVGSEQLVPVRLPERAGSGAGAPLLPDVLPVPGFNVLAVELEDVLGRPARVSVGDRPAATRTVGGHELQVVAEFWWHAGAPEQIGEELLVEYGQPVRVRLRLPVPYTPADADGLKLGLAQSEVVASEVVANGGTTTASFDLPFALWSVAGKLADRPREAYSQQLESRIAAYVATPLGRHDLELRLRTTRSTLRPVTFAELGDAPAPLRELRLLPVLAPEGPFAEPVPSDAPPRALFRPQVAVAVRAWADFLLLDRELPAAAARAVVAMLPGAVSGVPAARLVHADDPLGAARLEPGHLLPPGAANALDDEPLVGVDFYQAYTLVRLLGQVTAGDPGLFRLPLGCELELAAYTGANSPACNGPAAAGHPVRADAFREAARTWSAGRPPTTGADVRAGDVVASAFGNFAGLDFGVREWVADLPHVPGAELLLAEWVGDRAVHLEHVGAFAAGTAVPPRDLATPLRIYGVVRGLALGEVDGLLAPGGTRLDPRGLATVPASVPGVLRSEQLRRDGRDLVSAEADPRLERTGFRVACDRERLARPRGGR